MHSGDGSDRFGGSPLGELEALAAKYVTLARLRARREQLEATGALAFEDGERDARRDDFRRVARAFPGALRELDVSPAALLAAKAAAVAAELEAARSTPVRVTAARAWITIVLDFHATWRELLAIKLWLARRRPAPEPIDDELVVLCRAWYETLPEADRRVGWPLDAASLDLLRRPPGGRVTPFVWKALTARHGLSHADVVHAIFGAPAGIDASGALPVSAPGGAGGASGIER